MATKSGIEWTEQTWNPVTGCTKISDGCKHCYAKTFAERLQKMGTKGYERGFQVALHPDRLAQPIARTKPTVYFVNSMSDLFHDQVPVEFIERILETVKDTPQHRYQVLTKRPDSMAKFFESRPVPDNVWLGVSVENRKHGVPRIGQLAGIKARIRFLSVEPLLEDVGQLDLSAIHWVIVGGESGPSARLMQPDWVRSIRDQCLKSKTAFFFKQWGSLGPDGQRRAKKKNGRSLDGVLWDELPLEQHA